MISKRTISLCCLAFITISLISLKRESQRFNKNTTVSQVLLALGDTPHKHYRVNPDKEEIRMGKELIYNGRTIGPNGRMSTYISKYFVCISCHNQLQEDPNLSDINPENRLKYAAKNKLKFLPATTFFGIYNRESWYNGDYYLKYGDLVLAANKSLAEATQLCAKVCSSGRYLKDWELEAILAYYSSIEIKLSDLHLNKSDFQFLNNSANNQNTIKWLKKKYPLKSGATFSKLPKDPIKGYPKVIGNPERGRQIFQLSCLACHQPGGVSPIILDSNSLTFNKFKRNIDKNDAYNIYEIITHGTYVAKGKPRYMPLFPQEKMDYQQIEDLKAYILREAKN